MEEELVNTFVAFTSATPAQAQQYLALTDGNVEQAVELFFSNPDLGNPPTTNPSATRPSRQTGADDEPIVIDDDEDVDDDVRITGATGHSVEDDEAMARRLQEEMYGVRGSGGAGAADLGEDGVRAPMARTTETLVGPGSDWRSDPTAMNEAVFEQMAARQQSRRRPQPGIFNQRETPSIWAGDDPTDPVVHREMLARATGGASEQTSKSNLLADLFRPPFDLIANIPWSEARDEGKDKEKWILVNVQDPSIFDCQVLNRDIWKNPLIKETIRESFIFLQYNKDDPRGQEYIQYYFAQFRDLEDAYPHIAIIDPRTGEQVKTWSGAPVPKPSDFLQDLHEFLDRYSLNMTKKNPVQAVRKEKRKDVAQMSEDEMLQMAMQNSLDNANGGSSTAPPLDEDPDALTRSNNTKGKERATSPLPPPTEDSSPFSLIPSNAPHIEPPATAPDTTRIQFRHSGGRVVRRFALADPVQRLYEWLKAEPLVAEKAGVNFELIAMGRNLIDALSLTVADAGLRNGTVMVEFVEE